MRPPQAFKTYTWMMFLSSIHGGARSWKLSGLGLGFGGTVKNWLLNSYVLLLQCASFRICLLAAVCSSCDGWVPCFPPLLIDKLPFNQLLVKRYPFLWIVRFSFLMMFSFLGLGCRGVQVRGGVMAEEAIGCAAFSPPCEMLGVQAAAWYCAYYSSDSTW